MIRDSLKMHKNLCLCRHFHLLDKRQIISSTVNSFIDVWPINLFQPQMASFFDNTSLFMLQVCVCVCVTVCVCGGVCVWVSECVLLFLWGVGGGYACLRDCVFILVCAYAHKHCVYPNTLTRKHTLLHTNTHVHTRVCLYLYFIHTNTLSCTQIHTYTLMYDWMHMCFCMLFAYIIVHSCPQWGLEQVYGSRETIWNRIQCENQSHIHKYITELCSVALLIRVQCHNILQLSQPEWTVTGSNAS